MAAVAAVSSMQQLIAPEVVVVSKALSPRQRVSQQFSLFVLFLAPLETSKALPFSCAFPIAPQLHFLLRISCIRLEDELASPCS